jgi:hypothetical protein
MTRMPADVLPHFALIEHDSDEAGYVDRAYLESVLKQPLPDCSSFRKRAPDSPLSAPDSCQRTMK